MNDISSKRYLYMYYKWPLHPSQFTKLFYYSLTGSEPEGDISIKASLLDLFHFIVLIHP